MSLLREFLSVVEQSVFENHGTLDKFLGDGFMATFGTPWVGPQGATNALRCACQMVDKVAAWNERRAASGLPELYIGVGIHRGEVVLGEIGSERRLEFAVIGDAVNVASRLQEMTRNFQLAIVASDDVIAAARSGRAGSLGASFVLSDRMSFAAVMGGLGCGARCNSQGVYSAPAWK